MKLFRKKRKNKYVEALLVGTAVVLFWRGMWGILDLYFFPENKLLSFSISIIAGLIILFLTHTWVKELE